MHPRAGRHMRIRPPRRGPNESDRSFESDWKTISSAIRQIHTKNASELSYEVLYRHAYRVVLRKNGEQLYESVLQFERNWLTDEVKTRAARLLSDNLMADLHASSANLTLNERRMAGERFLKGIRGEWQDYQLCMSMLADVLLYMERVYCTENHQMSIYASSLGLFRDGVLHSQPNPQHSGLTVQDLLVRIILDQVHMERTGDVIDKHLIKSCVYMMENLFETDQECEDQCLYAVAFEQPFLDASRAFYQTEGDILLRQADAGTYCRHTSCRLQEEADRCRTTLSESTTLQIERVVEQELIEHRIRDLIESESGVKFMIANDRTDELALLYGLNARIDDKKAELARAVQGLVVELGNEINQAATSAALTGASPTPGAAEDADVGRKTIPDKVANLHTLAAIKWAEDVLLLKEKFDLIWERAFESDQTMQTALTRSFTQFLNSTTFPRSSEYISLFIDENMKKGIKDKTSAEIDTVLDKAIILLRYISDKDLFERYYKKHLCKRLLMARSLSDDVEVQMISRMKIELGNSFTSKLEAMFKDMAISQELTSDFKTHVAGLPTPDPERIELAVNVLTSVTWPLEFMVSRSSEAEQGMRHRCILPVSIERLRMSFEQFYGERHSGRRLNWLPTMGSADIRATFPNVPTKDGTRERTHELKVSTYSMIILLLFNDLGEGEALTFDEIQAKTNIPTHDLVRNLQSLAVAPRTRILLKQPMSKEVMPTDTFMFNSAFVGKFHKLKVGVVAAGNKAEDDRERKETETRIDEKRGFCIDAAVVRIMKQRKELPHQKLIAETLTILRSQFKPDLNIIKKRIESLIDREYLERIEDTSPSAYRYLA